MRLDVEYWNGNDWEDHVLRLLQDMHGPENVQPVPAQHKGDCGIDYFCVNKAIVYQCYAPETIDMAERAIKQRDKITADLRLFCDPMKGAPAVVGKTKVKRWILVVPLHDSKDVVSHAMTKADEVQRRGLPHVDDDFQVLVHDKKAFDEVSWQRRSALRSRIQAKVAQVTDREIEELLGSGSTLEGNLRRKLSARMSDPKDLDDAIDAALRASMESGNAMEALRSTAPEAYEEIERLKSERLKRFKLGVVGGTGDRLDMELTDLKDKIVDAVPNLDPGLADTVTFGSVSEWLMRCPLKLD